MDLIKTVVKRSQFSDVAYIFLNVALAGVILWQVVAFQPPYIAYLIILLSKWRVFAVRPRFWLANLQTNMVDLLVGLSAVTLIWQAGVNASPNGGNAGNVLMVQCLLASLYAAWLIIVKPRSKRSFVLAQAGISQLVSLMALLSIAHMTDASIIVAVCWLIGYVAARHVLASYDDDDLTLLSMMWGFVVAEIGWIGYHWTLAYVLSGNLMIPQVAIIVALIGFALIKIYDSYHYHTFSWRAVRAPVLFASVVIVILLFSELSDILRYTT